MRKRISSLTGLLKTFQESDGCFVRDKNRIGTNDRGNIAVFDTAFVLGCLEKKPQQVRSLLRNGCCFIIEQRSLSGSINYQKRTGRKAYPDDLDDTFLCLSAVARHEPGMIDTEMLLSAVNILVHCETKEGGPYYTWIVPGEMRAKWDDVDIAVNSNVYHFLTGQDVTLDEMDEYFDDRIGRLDFSSKYYHRPIVVAYFLSKWYRGRHRQQLADYILSQRIADGTAWANPMETALAITALSNLGRAGSETEAATESLLGTDDESVAAPYPMFIERVAKGKTSYGGSAACTVAAVIEAIETRNRREPKVRRDGDSETVARIKKRAGLMLSRTPDLVRRGLDREIARIADSPAKNEVFLTGFRFHKHLHERLRGRISESDVLDLCGAGVLGWIGYGIYDDLMDGHGDPSLLPLANACAGAARRRFTKAPLPKAVSEAVEGILDGMEAATLWERVCARTHPCDYGDLSALWEKSLGHAIGPLVITAAAAPRDRASRAAVLEFFRHYLAARQLNDDAHDWTDDLREGRVNPVGAMMLDLDPESSRAFSRDGRLDPDPSLVQAFWDSVLDRVASLIRKHTGRAREAAGRIRVLSNAEFLCDLLVPLERAADSAVSERERVREFIGGYGDGK